MDFSLGGMPAGALHHADHPDVSGSVEGAGITIAVVDDAIDTRHPEFAGRVTPGRAMGEVGHSTLPRGWQPHGTKVAGLALAGGIKVRGIAPQALLMGIRVPTLARCVGDATEGDAIRWAAENGADVICCAWGPPNPTAESGKLPARTRAAINWALEHGRKGKGCVVVLSSGNDGGDISLNGYASHPGVVAVGACNCHGRHPTYSGWGRALWCVFPSNDPHDPVGAAATYTTTTPIGSFLLGDTFYSSFGFTSAACAAIAGLCALILCANPGLTWPEVREVLAQSCTKIDVEGGSYDGHGHSRYYGFGCPDPARAVEIARGKSEVRSV